MRTKAVTLLPLPLLLSILCMVPPAAGADGLPRAELDALLTTFRPHLYCTNDEFSPPVEAQVMLDASYLVDGDTGEVVCEGYEPIKVDFEVLKRYDAPNYRLKMYRDYTKLLGKDRRANYRNSRPVVYARAVDLPADGLVALQYMFFYAGSFIPKLVTGTQMPWHEGDTEYAHILLDRATLRPVGAAGSAHYYGMAHRWDDCLLAPDGRVKMYVAQHSHATYLHPSRGLGHQCLKGNQGYGGDVTFTVVACWDEAKEEQEVDYEVRVLPDDHIFYRWQGTWGSVERRAGTDEGLKSHVMGPSSFAYRNADSARLNMFEHPAYWHYFYYTPSTFYKRLVLSIREVKDLEVRDGIYDVVERMGRMRARVDDVLAGDACAVLDERQRNVIAEAVPFVVLSLSQGRLRDIWTLGSDKLGADVFEKMLRAMVTENLNLVLKYVKGQTSDILGIVKDPLDFFTVPVDKLMGFIAEASGVERARLPGIYGLESEERAVENFGRLYGE